MRFLGASSRFARSVALGLAFYLAFVAGPFSAPRPVYGDGGASLTVAIIAIVVSVITTAAATAATMPTDKPSIHLDEFSLAVAEDFNVGDHGTINLRVTVSYGSISDSLSDDETGSLNVKFYADGKLLSQATRRQTGAPIIRTYTFDASVIGVRPGSTRIHADLTLRGQISGVIDDDWHTTTDKTPVRVLNVAEPYTVWIDGPAPDEVLHGESSQVKLKVKVRTEDYSGRRGLVGARTQVNGKQAPVEFLPGAANAGASYEKVLITADEVHSGCKHRPPHPPFFNLRFEPNSYRLFAFFDAKPYRYLQTSPLDAVFAKDVPYDPPICDDPETYSPSLCRCVGEEQGLRTPTPSRGTRTASFNTAGGDLLVRLPADAAPGDTLSGTVAAEPRDEGSDVLEGMVVEVGEEKTSAGRRVFQVVAPLGATAIPIILRNADGSEAGRQTLELDPAAPRPADFQPPRFGQTGRDLEVPGPFDGAWTNTQVTLGDRPPEFIAESPGQTIWRLPVDAAGATELTVDEAGNRSASPFNLLEARLQADRTNLLQGQKATVKTTVSGLDGLDLENHPVTVEIHNLTPQVVRFEDQASDLVLRHPIAPNRVRQDGTYSFKTKVRGLRTGAFSLRADLVPGNER